MDTSIQNYERHDDLYSGYNEYSTEFDTKDLENDELLRDALRSSYERRPTAVTDNTSQLIRRVVGSSNVNDQLLRPITAVRGAGYVSQKINTFDPLNLATKSHTDVFDSPKGTTVEDQIKESERKVMELIDESCLAESAGDLRLALEKAKEASSKEHSLIRLLEQTGHDDSHNFELTFSVLFSVAHQYVTNEMYVEALNMYQVITKNKVFQNGSRLKINMANIYAQLGQLQKSIKMYKWALDHVPNTNKDLRIKIMHNIGIIFIKMKQFDEACANFEYIMQEKPDLKAGFHALICYYIMGNRDMMKKSFEAMLNIPVETFQFVNSSYNTFQNDTSQNILHEVIKHDTLSTLEKELRKEAENRILIAASLLSHSIDDNYMAGYNRCSEMLKGSQYASLIEDLEINKAITILRSNDISKAIDILKGFEKKDSLVASIASTNLSFIHFLHGDLSKAELFGISARNCDVYNSSAYVNIGNCMFSQTEYEKAKEFYNQALENDSSCVEALYNIGLTNKKMGQFEQALDCFTKLQSIVTNNCEVLYQIAHLYELLGDVDQSLEWYMQLISIVPSDAGVLQKIGDIFDSEHDKQQALHYYFESYRHYPSNLTIIDWLGAHFVELRLTNKAVTYFEKASLIQPDEPKWRLLVGSCHRRAGNYQLALQIYKETLNKFPDNLECLKLLVHMGTELGLKETPEYIENLRKAEKSKELRDRINTGRSTVTRYNTGNGSSSSWRAGSSSSISSGDDNSFIGSNLENASNLLSSAGAINNRVSASMLKNQAVANYTDPLDPVVERPRTSTGYKTKPNQNFIINDDFADEELGDDLLPE